MTDRSNVLLVTGAIDILAFDIPYTALNDTSVRLEQYVESLKYAIRNYKSIQKIVFCENTNFNYDYSELIKEALKFGKKLEILSFLGDYEVIKEKGKGYGEGEIINYAINHSILLNRCVGFYKLTGRVTIQNMDKVISYTNSSTAFLFMKSLRFRDDENYVSTVFYKVELNFYKKVLLEAYKEVEDSKKRYLEYVFYDKLKKINCNSFGKYPIVSGISGSTGFSYQQSKISLFKSNIYILLGLYSNRVK